MTTLHEVNFGINQYCGPSVLSALTGRSTDECAAVISSITGQTVIKGVFTRDLVKALEKLRFDCTLVNGGISLYGTLMRLLRSGDAKYVVIVPKHFVAVEINNGSCYLVDNHSKQPLNASGSARLMQKVEAVFKVVEREKPELIREEIKVVKWEAQKLIQLQRLSVYKNPEDNVLVKLGQFNYNSRSELSDIAAELMKASMNFDV